ncbi:MAG: aldolase, partial [Alphaproteobacteria bacterium]|nr:aldolase [Alphaproteobacteria bacterium]
MLTYGTAVAIGDRAVLLRGASGAGKSDLALRLIDEGAQLVADDQVYVEARDSQTLMDIDVPKVKLSGMALQLYV